MKKKKSLSKRNTSTRYVKTNLSSVWEYAKSEYQWKPSEVKQHEECSALIFVVFVFNEQPPTILDALHGTWLNVTAMNQMIWEVFQR